MKAALGGDYELKLCKVPKNDGLILDGLYATRENTHIAPTIYLNPCYDQYCEGVPLDQIVAELLVLYHRNGTPSLLDYQILPDYEGIRPHIACKLVHATSSEAILKDIPHVLWMDLAIAFYLYIHEDDTGLMTTMIHDGRLCIWSISLGDLKTSALANSPRLFPPVTSSMACIIEELNRQPNPHSRGTGPRPETSTPFYVLSSYSGINGAVCLLYEDVLENFAEGIEEDLVILPSSVREVLLLSDDSDISHAEMNRLVTHINRSKVPKGDRLFNQVYFRSRNAGSIAMTSAGPASVC